MARHTVKNEQPEVCSHAAYHLRNCFLEARAWYRGQPLHLSFVLHAVSPRTNMRPVRAQKYYTVAAAFECWFHASNPESSITPTLDKIEKLP